MSQARSLLVDDTTSDFNAVVLSSKDLFLDSAHSVEHHVQPLPAPDSFSQDEYYCAIPLFDHPQATTPHHLPPAAIPALAVCIDSCASCTGIPTQTIFAVQVPSSASPVNPRILSEFHSCVQDIHTLYNLTTMDPVLFLHLQGTLPDQDALFASLRTSFIVSNSVWWSLYLALLTALALLSFRRLAHSLRPPLAFLAPPPSSSYSYHTLSH